MNGLIMSYEFSLGVIIVFCLSKALVFVITILPSKKLQNLPQTTTCKNLLVN